MKNKKNIFFLLPAVMIIWGVLGYRIFTSLSPTNTVTSVNLATTQFIPQKIEASESFTINTEYRDPFLGTVSKKPSIKTKRSTKKVTITPQKPFPTIIYKGVVAATGKKEQVFIISINGQQQFFKKNSTKNDVKLLRGTITEIVVQFQGQKQTFPIIK
ncbi:hypothetical protein [Aureibaculum luteum]|uniref:hypothetical protein n=1 Tax=Aureibaculum luteum TaxID=1548456 RepID=UPI000E557BDF|nr:hypothetical protein [Aureibaculum luteum]